jgi:16S rRNA (uracil1498-N3)-methyltransferase
LNSIIILPKDRLLIFCDESKVGETVEQLRTIKSEKWAILIGPEGGFSDFEIKYLQSLDFVISISLGPRLLRADTAVIAALALWQSQKGDWL